MEETFDIKFMADLLRGEIVGPYQIRAPGPGRPETDRTLFVMFDQFLQDEMFVHSFAGEDPSFCLKYVLFSLGETR